MATKESKRVDEHRRKYFDRISSLIEKGGNALINTLAIREGVTKAEVIRRSILARAGLRSMPFPDDLNALEEVETKEEANYAIMHLQRKEEKNEIINKLLQELSPEPDSAKYDMKIDHDTRRCLLHLAGYDDPEIAELLKNRWGEEQNITASGFDIGHIRRMLANIQHIDAE